MSNRLGWSTKAHRVSKAAASARIMYEIRAERNYERMKKGPYLEPDENDENGAVFLVVPSDWYSEVAKEFWASMRFQFNKNEGLPSWVLWVDSSGRKADTHGKKFTAAQWLKSARTHFFHLHEKAFAQVEKQIEEEAKRVQVAEK